jgi:hypothetical protein
MMKKSSCHPKNSRTTCPLSCIHSHPLTHSFPISLRLFNLLLSSQLDIITAMHDTRAHAGTHRKQATATAAIDKAIERARGKNLKFTELNDDERAELESRFARVMERN